MSAPRPLPSSLSTRFSVRDAADAGVNRGRLRRADLTSPFHGVRDAGPRPALRALDPFEKQAAERRIRARQYAPLLTPHQFFSHDSAIALLGGPLPLETDKGEIVDGMTLPVHVSTLGSGPLVRVSGVTAHRANTRNTVVIRSRNGYVMSSPASAWAQSASWDLMDLVALGDYFCRAWRSGPGRKNPGKRPLATVDELRAVAESGRRVGIARLREALDLVREDSWSPRESKIRCLIVFEGMPEPRLNYDVYDAFGHFLGCVDLAYPELKVAIEYQSMLHHDRYAHDVERIAALRAAGWVVIEVTSELFADPRTMIGRIRDALAR